MRFLAALIFINLSIFSQAQRSPLKDLLTDNRPVAYITFEKRHFFEEADTTFRTHIHKIIKTETGVFVFIDGTGRLYQVIENGDKPIFKRIDSTVNFGYNIAAFPFSYDNKIYNLGGYGFWRMNGQLRVFNEKDKQWDVVKLNEEVPFLFDETNSLLWYDIKAGQIYLGFAIHRDEAVKSDGIDESKFEFVTRVLDLKSKTWNKLGVLNKMLIEKAQDISTISMSPWGQLVLIGDKINLIDFKGNQLFVLKDDNAYYSSIVRNRYLSSFYFRDSTLLFGSNASGRLDSVRMHLSDFMPLNEPIFIKEPPKTFLPKVGLFLIITLMVGILYWQINKAYKIKFEKRIGLLSNKSTSNVTPISNELVSSNRNGSFFEEIELQLLNLVISNSEEGLLTTIEEINKVLGVTKRSIEIQKKQRSDIITSINRKYVFAYPNSESIILKRRSEIDKRSFEYYIEPFRIDSVKYFLNKA